MFKTNKIKLFTIIIVLIMLTSCKSINKNQDDAAQKPQDENTNTQTELSKNVFDENNVVLSFGALSDIHITGKLADDSDDKLRSAIVQLRAAAAKHDKDGLDAIAMAGDVTDNGTRAQVETLTDILRNMDMTDVMLATGNHDKQNGAGSILGYYDVMGNDFFKHDVDKIMMKKGARHCILNGYHFIFIEPKSYSKNCPYDDSVMTWLDNTLGDITSQDPNSYVFIFTHPMPYNTCYGSTLEGGAWYTDHLATVISKYPQVVTFSGHRHSPINDERSIMQTDFTALGCGSVRYAGLAQMISNVKISGVPGDSYNVSTGLLVQVDANGNLRITRMYFSDYSTFKDPWELPFPTEDKEHLKKYSRDRQNQNSAPVLTGTPKLETIKSDQIDVIATANLTVPAASDDDLINHYKVIVKNLDTGFEFSYIFISDFYRHSTPSKMAKELSFPLTFTDTGKHRIEVVAVDSWDVESNMIFCEAIIGEGENGLNAELPAVYADFEFTNGSIYDTNNKFSIDLSGATITNQKLIFAGVTKNIDAMTVSKKGQHATVRFKDYNASTMTQFYNSTTGFTVEALYVNRAPNASQGIVCGTQSPGGWGLAENGGTPYLYTYLESGSIRITSQSAASTTELNHVVCTFVYKASTNQTITSIYINGKLICTGSNYGKIATHDSEKIANAFCFGSDISANGTGGDLPMTDFILADVKIYAEAINYKQANTAYKNAVESFKN